MTLILVQGEKNGIRWQGKKRPWPILSSACIFLEDLRKTAQYLNPQTELWTLNDSNMKTY